MKIAVINKGKIVVKETPDIELNGREGAIVKVLGCGLCGSDIVKFIHKISKDGTVLGHEIVAEIVEIQYSDTKSLPKLLKLILKRTLKSATKLLHRTISPAGNAFTAKTETFQCASILNQQTLSPADLANMFICRKNI